MKRKKGAAVTVTVAKWFADVGADERLWIESIAWSNKTANPGNILTIRNEDGDEPVLQLALTTAGASGQHFFVSGRKDDLGFPITIGKDLAVVVSGGTTDCWIMIQCSTDKYGPT